MIVVPSASGRQDSPNDVESTVRQAPSDLVATKTDAILNRDDQIRTAEDEPAESLTGVKPPMGSGNRNDSTEHPRRREGIVKEPKIDAEIENEEVNMKCAEEAADGKYDYAVHVKISEDVENLAASANRESANDAIAEPPYAARVAAPRTFMRQSRVSSGCFLILTETLTTDTREAIPLFHQKPLPISAQEWKEWKKPKKNVAKKASSSGKKSPSQSIVGEETAEGEKSRSRSIVGGESEEGLSAKPEEARTLNEEMDERIDVVTDGTNKGDEVEAVFASDLGISYDSRPPESAPIDSSANGLPSVAEPESPIAHNPSRNPLPTPADCGPALEKFGRNRHKWSSLKGEGDLYTCPLCTNTFKRTDCLADHIDSVHDNRAYLCVHCGDHVFARRRRGEHLIKVHKIYDCRGGAVDPHYRVVNRSDIRPVNQRKSSDDGKTSPRKRKIPKAAVAAKALAKTVAMVRPIATSSYSHFDLNDGDANVKDTEGINGADLAGIHITNALNNVVVKSDANDAGGGDKNNEANFEIKNELEQQTLDSKPPTPNEKQAPKLSQPHLILQEILKQAPHQMPEDPVDFMGSQRLKSSQSSPRSQHHSEQAERKQSPKKRAKLEPSIDTPGKDLASQQSLTLFPHRQSSSELPIHQPSQSQSFLPLSQTLTTHSLSHAPSPQIPHQPAHSPPFIEVATSNSSSTQSLFYHPSQQSSPHTRPFYLSVGQPSSLNDAVIETSSRQSSVSFDQSVAFPPLDSSSEHPSQKLSNVQKLLTSREDDLDRQAASPQHRPDVLPQNSHHQLLKLISQSPPSQMSKQQLNLLQQQLYQQQHQQKVLTQQQLVQQQRRRQQQSELLANQKQQTKPNPEPQPKQESLSDMIDIERRFDSVPIPAKDTLSGLTSVVMSAFTGGSSQRSDIPNSSRSQPPALNLSSRPSAQSTPRAADSEPTIVLNLSKKQDQPSKSRGPILDSGRVSFDPRCTSTGRSTSGPIIKLVRPDGQKIVLDGASRMGKSSYPCAASIPLPKRIQTSGPGVITDNSCDNTFTETNKLTFNDLKIKAHVPNTVPKPLVAVSGGSGGKAGVSTNTLLASMINSNDPISTYLQASSFQLSSNLSASSNQASSSKTVPQRNADLPTSLQSSLRTPAPVHPSTQPYPSSSDPNLSFSSFLDHGKS